MLDTQFPLLLHSFVQDTPPELDGLWNIPHLWRTASEQNLLPVLAYENKRWKLFDDPNVCRQLDGLLYGTVATNLNRCVDFETLSASFTEHGIAHMPVKGYYLRKLYPTPELRTFGDIDLLIHPEDRQKVHNLMLSLGYTVKQDWEPTYSYIKDAEYYEIHTNLMDGNLDGRTDLQAYFDAAWAHAEPDDGLRFRPEDDFHFIYTVCHLAKHLYGGGAGLRMRCSSSSSRSFSLISSFLRTLSLDDASNCFSSAVFSAVSVLYAASYFLRFVRKASAPGTYLPSSASNSSALAFLLNGFVSFRIAMI